MKRKRKIYLITEGGRKKQFWQLKEIKRKVKEIYKNRKKGKNYLKCWFPGKELKIKKGIDFRSQNRTFLIVDKYEKSIDQLRRQINFFFFLNQ